MDKKAMISFGFVELAHFSQLVQIRLCILYTTLYSSSPSCDPNNNVKILQGCLKEWVYYVYLWL